jgi:hypothetical protein
MTTSWPAWEGAAERRAVASVVARRRREAGTGWAMGWLMEDG